MATTTHGEPYIHLTWHDSIASGMNHSDGEVSSMYAKYAAKKKVALRTALGMNAKDAGDIIRQVTGFYDAIEKKGDALTQAFLKTGMNAANSARNTNPLAMKSMASKIIQSESWMKETVGKMQEVLDQSEAFNKDLIKYFVGKSINPTSLATRGIQLDKLRLMDLEKKTGTSLKSLQRSLSAINMASSSYNLPLKPEYVGRHRCDLK